MRAPALALPALEVAVATSTRSARPGRAGRGSCRGTSSSRRSATRRRTPSKTLSRPSASASRRTRAEPGTTMTRTPSAFLRPLTIDAKARRSSMRLLVHEPMKTASTATSFSGVPGLQVHVLERALGGGALVRVGEVVGRRHDVRQRHALAGVGAPRDERLELDSADHTRRRCSSSMAMIGSRMTVPFANVTIRASPSRTVSTTKPGTSRVWSEPMSRMADQTARTGATVSTYFVMDAIWDSSGSGRRDPVGADGPTELRSERAHQRAPTSSEWRRAFTLGCVIPENSPIANSTLMC